MILKNLKEDLIGKLIDVPELDNVMLSYGFQCYRTITESSIVYNNRVDMIRIFTKVVIEPNVLMVLNMEYC
jgi:hypothetical protein